MTSSVHRSLRSLSILGLGLALISTTLLLTSCGKKDEPVAAGPQFTTDDQRVSYGIGFNIGSNLAKQRGLTVDKDAFAAGVSDSLAGEKPRLDEKVIQAAFAAMEARVNEVNAKLATANLAAGQAHLAKNKAKKGVTTTASGLQYEVIKAGKGKKPKTTDNVEVHYHGTLIDGTVFDSSVERGQTIEFPVTGVIKGWTEALQLMPVGSKWRLTIPADLAYGAADRGKISPNSTLIFDVELVAIK